MAKTVAQPYDTLVSEVIELLRAEGFGVLTDIDVRATLKSRIGGDMSRYRILGACNPSLAHKALKMEDKLGVAPATESADQGAAAAASRRI